MMSRLAALAAVATALTARPGQSPGRRLVVRRASELGVLPFAANEILLPGDERYLHLYEARFLALFEHATKSCDHVVVLAFSLGENLLATATLATIESWERLDVGVGATIRGDARCKLSGLRTDEPYILATVEPIADDRDDEAAAERCRQLLDEVNELGRRHAIETDSKTRNIAVDPRAVLLPQASPANDVTDLTGRASDRISQLELQSFLALKGAPVEVKLKALVTRDQKARWLLAEDDLDRQRRELAAKAAIKNLDLSWDDAARS